MYLGIETRPFFILSEGVNTNDLKETTMFSNTKTSWYISYWPIIKMNILVVDCVAHRTV